MAGTKMVRANRSFAAAAGEVEYFIREGDLVPTSHPVAKEHPELFGAPERLFEAPGEQTTAARGQVR